MFLTYFSSIYLYLQKLFKKLLLHLQLIQWHTTVTFVLAITAKLLSGQVCCQSCGLVLFTAQGQCQRRLLLQGCNIVEI